MSNLRKEVLKVKVGQMFKFIGTSDYFTKGRGDYAILEIDYDNGSQTTSVEFVDDQGDLHFVSDNFLSKNFTPTIVKNYRNV